MVIHSYCSYTYSAVGYQYGTYNVSTPSADGDFSDTENQKLSIISAAFDSGMIRELYGKYNDYYLYLVKKLKYESPDDIEVGKELFINIAFSFSLDEKEEFYAFKENISALSNDEKERASLTSRVTICAAIGGFLMTAAATLLPTMFGASTGKGAAAIYAIMHGQSLNSFIEGAVEEKLAQLNV